MKKTITILSMLLAFASYSQTAIKKESIDSGGATASNGDTAIIYTIGEVVVQESSEGTISISEGFISPDILAFIGVQDYTSLAGVSVFPNPTTDYINISFSEVANYNITVFDYLGKQIEELNTQQTAEQSLDMQSYSSGVYLVVVKNTAKQQYKTYKVVKD